MRGIFILVLLVFLGNSGPPARAADPGIVSPEIFESKALLQLHRQLRQQSPELAKIDTLASQSGIFSIHHLRFTKNGQRYPVIMEIKQTGEVRHLGLALFTEHSWEDRSELLRFLERYFLELALSSSAAEILARDQVVLSYNDEPFGSLTCNDFGQIATLIFAAEQFAINKIEYQYQAEWIKAGSVVRCRFPAQVQLILGQDKRELDAALIAALVAADAPAARHPADRPVLGDHYRDSTGLIVNIGPEFYPGISRTTFFRIAAADTVPLFDAGHPRPSLLNYLLYPTLSSVAVPLELTVRSRNPVTQLLSYKQLHDCLGAEYLTYAGIENISIAGYDVIVIFESRRCDHLHMAVLHVPACFPGSNGEENWTGKLYPYIRRDNVAELFSRVCSPSQGDRYQIKLE